jgi:hypothetical protein
MQLRNRRYSIRVAIDIVADGEIPIAFSRACNCSRVLALWQDHG